MTTRILLVRHGATVLSAEDRFAGSTDVELGPDGRMQTERLGQRLAGEEIAALYCSPMHRAIETAETLGRWHGLTCRTLDGLREVDHGSWEGLRRSEVAARYPEEYAAWEQDPFNHAPTRGETGAAVLERAVRTVAGIVREHPGETVLVVSHKATIRLLIADLLGFDPRHYRDRLDQLPACLNILDFHGPGDARLMLFNDVSHYASEPRVAWPAGGDRERAAGPIVRGV